MRQIKFRGKYNKDNLHFLKDYDYWIYGSGIIYKGRENKHRLCIQSDLFLGADFLEVDKKTIGQFTGVYDSKGNEIYEGDILSPISSEGFNYEVKFENGEFAMYSKHGFWGSLSKLDDVKVRFDINIRVIGNIFDNPELMKDEKK